jgi:hypothetical protein
MNSPTAQTALFGLIAGIISLVAAWYYPWPENLTRSDLVGKPLFESLEAKDVRTITVTEYDLDRNGLKQIVVRRSGEFWTIPAHQNFIANNAAQISEAINSVNTNVLEQRSNDLQDHVEYGVVDPMEFESTPARNSLGKKIVLQDRNNRELASLIVGGAPRDDANVNQTRRFVRITGKPGVYVVEINESALTTDFSRWVSSNLLEITDPNSIRSLTIKNYRSEKSQLATDEPIKLWRYQLNLDAKNQKQALLAPNSQGELMEAEISADHANAIRQIGMYLTNIAFTDVRKKQKSLADLLKAPQTELVKGLSRLNESGFAAVAKQPDRNFGLQLQSTGGEFVLELMNGVSISLLVGDLVEAQTGEFGDLSRLVMLYATLDPQVLPLPEKPAGDDENEQKAYLRLVADREAKIKEAEKQVKLLNDYYGDWYFVVSEQILNGLMPELRVEVASDAKANPPEVDSDEDSGRTADENTNGENGSETESDATQEENER